MIDYDLFYQFLGILIFVCLFAVVLAVSYSLYHINEWGFGAPCSFSLEYCWNPWPLKLFSAFYPTAFLLDGYGTGSPDITADVERTAAHYSSANLGMGCRKSRHCRYFKTALMLLLQTGWWGWAYQVRMKTKLEGIGNSKADTNGSAAGWCRSS